MDNFGSNRPQFQTEEEDNITTESKQTANTFGSNRPNPKDISNVPKEPEPTYREKQQKLSVVADDNERISIVRGIVNSGVDKLSQVKPEKFGADPMVFTMRYMFDKHKELGMSAEESQASMDAFIIDQFGEDTLKKYKDQAVSGHRFQNGLASTVMEAYNGLQEIMGIEPSQVDRDQADILYMDKERASVYHNFSNSYNDDDNGKLKHSWDVQTGFGETAPALIVGGGVGLGVKIAGAGIKTALMADFVSQQALSYMEYTGVSGLDDYAGTQYALETGGNFIGIGIGAGLNKVFSKASRAIDPAVAEAVSKVDTERAAGILKAMQIAKENGITILGHDVDPTTLVSKLQDVSKNSPLVSKQLQEVTNSDVKAVVNYIAQLEQGFSDVATTNSSMGEFIVKSIDAQDDVYAKAIDLAYGQLETIQKGKQVEIQNATFVKWMSDKIGEINKRSDLGVAATDEMTTYLEKQIARMNKAGEPVGVQDMYNIMRDTIGRSAELRKTAGKAQESRGMAILGDMFDGQFDNMTKGDPQLAEASRVAREVYADRIDLLGGKNTGKGAKGTGIVADFRAKYELDPEGAMKLLNTPQKVREVKQVLNADGLRLLQRNRISGLVEQAGGIGNLNLVKLSNLIESDSVILKELLGKDYAMIKASAKIAEMVGKRAQKLATNNSFSLLNTLQTQSFIGTAYDAVLGRMKGKGLMALDAKQAQGLMAELERVVKESGVGSLDDFLNHVKASNLPEITVARPLDEIFTPLEGVDEIVPIPAKPVVKKVLSAKAIKELKAEVAQTAREINANLKTKLTDEPLKQRYNELRAKLVKEQTPELVDELKKFGDEVAELPSKDPAADIVELQKIAQERAERLAKSEVAKQQATQNTRVSKEINAMFRTRVPEGDSRLLYNRIQETIATASNKGDEAKVAEGLNQLNVFREYMADLPKRLDADELKALQLKAAREEAERLNAQGIRDAAERNARIQTARETAETRNTTDVMEARARQNVARNTEVGVETVATTRQARFERASNSVVENLNSNTNGTWTRSGSEAHPNFRSDTGESFTLHIYGNSIGATTTGLTNGSGSGKAVYPAIWDMARDLGGVYTPDSTLLTANPVRMGMNMLSYADSLGGKDIPWIHIGRSQAGIQGRGLANQPLTKANQKSLATGLRNYAQSRLPAGTRLNTTATPEQLEKWGDILGRNSNIRLGKDSLTRLRNWLYSSKPGLTLGAGVMAAVLADEELMDYLDSL